MQRLYGTGLSMRAYSVIRHVPIAYVYKAAEELTFHGILGTSLLNSLAAIFIYPVKR